MGSAVVSECMTVGTSRRTKSGLGVVVLDHQIFRIRRQNDLPATNQHQSTSSETETRTDLALDRITLERLQSSREQSMLLHIFDRFVKLLRSGSREILQRARVSFEVIVDPEALDMRVELTEIS